MWRRNQSRQMSLQKKRGTNLLRLARFDGPFISSRCFAATLGEGPNPLRVNRIGAGDFPLDEKTVAHLVTETARAGPSYITPQ